MTHGGPGERAGEPPHVARPPKRQATRRAHCENTCVEGEGESREHQGERRKAAVEPSMSNSPLPPTAATAAAAAAATAGLRLPTMAVSSEQGLSSSSSAGNGSDNDTFTVPLRIVAPGTVAPHGSGAGEYAPTRLPSSTTDAPPIGGTQAQTREHVFGRCLLKRGALSYCPGQGKPQVTVDDAVLGFDSALYDRKMSPSSPQFDPTFDVDLLNAAIFRVGEVWASRDLLCKALDCRASCEGFTKKIEKKWVGCNRVGEPSSTRVFAGGELKANCTLHMTIKPLVKSRYERPKKQDETKVKYEYKDQWDMPIELVDNENASR